MNNNLALDKTLTQINNQVDTRNQSVLESRMGYSHQNFPDRKRRFSYQNLNQPKKSEEGSILKIEDASDNLPIVVSNFNENVQNQETLSQYRDESFNEIKNRSWGGSFKNLKCDDDNFNKENNDEKNDSKKSQENSFNNKKNGIPRDLKNIKNDFDENSINSDTPRIKGSNLKISELVINEPINSENTISLQKPQNKFDFLTKLYNIFMNDFSYSQLVLKFIVKMNEITEYEISDEITCKIRKYNKELFERMDDINNLYNDNLNINNPNLIQYFSSGNDILQTDRAEL